MSLCWYWISYRKKDEEQQYVWSCEHSWWMATEVSKANCKPAPQQDNHSAITAFAINRKPVQPSLEFWITFGRLCRPAYMPVCSRHLLVVQANHEDEKNSVNQLSNLDRTYGKCDQFKTEPRNGSGRNEGKAHLLAQNKTRMPKEASIWDWIQFVAVERKREDKGSEEARMLTIDIGWQFQNENPLR